MKTKLYLLCIFLFFVAVILAVYSGNSPLSPIIWTLGFITGLLLEMQS